jgi:phosphoglycolate phosphatase-like HAD superfamily hydrolase
LPSPSLVLFDIDGTLVRGTGPYHPRALVQAVRDVTGVETTTEGIPIHGMLDSVILTLMLQRIAVPPEDIPALIPRIGGVAEEIYLATVPDLRDKTCPGVPALLEALTARNMVLALVTGNLTRIGWRKLEQAGVHHHFRYGAFGEMAETRSSLATHVIDWARREGVIDSGSRISLIGDTPNDVKAARDNGIQAIGVRTGITPQGEMEACAPDILLDDLTTLDPLWL